MRKDCKDLGEEGPSWVKEGGGQVEFLHLCDVSRSEKVTSTKHRPPEGHLFLTLTHPRCLPSTPPILPPANTFSTPKMTATEPADPPLPPATPISSYSWSGFSSRGLLHKALPPALPAQSALSWIHKTACSLRHLFLL